MAEIGVVTVQEATSLDQGAISVRFWGGLSSWLADSCLPVSSHGLPSSCKEGEEQQEREKSSNRGTNFL